MGLLDSRPPHMTHSASSPKSKWNHFKKDAEAHCQTHQKGEVDWSQDLVFAFTKIKVINSFHKTCLEKNAETKIPIRVECRNIRCQRGKRQKKKMSENLHKNFSVKKVNREIGKSAWGLGSQGNPDNMTLCWNKTVKKGKLRMQGKKDVGRVLKEEVIGWKVVPQRSKSFMRSETRHHIPVLDKKVVQLVSMKIVNIF